MNRKRWSELSPAYRKRLERFGITAAMHARGDTLVRARGHFHSPKKRRGLYEREKFESSEWNAVRHRAKKLAAYESIRRSFLQGDILRDTIRETVEFYEALELQYEEDGPEAHDYLAEWDNWYYRYMPDKYPDYFLMPPLQPYYHGRVGK